MKIFIAYTLVTVGIPYLAGQLIGRVVTFPVAMVVGLLRRLRILGGSDAATAAQDFGGAMAWSCRGPIKMSMPDRGIHIFMDIGNGVGAALVAGLIFHLFGSAPGINVLLILAAWEIMFTIFCEQALRALVGSLVGIVMGSLWISFIFPM